MAFKFVASLIICTLPVLASAQVYTWKDANGRTHFSDQPSAAAEAKPLRGNASSQMADAPRSNDSAPTASASSPKDAKTSGPKTWEDQDREFKQRRAEQAEAEAKAKKEQDTKAEKDRYCTSLRNNLAMLERGGRVSQPGPNGEQNVMGDSQLKSEADRVRGQLSKDCK